MFESSVWSALVVMLLAAPAWAQAPAVPADPPARPAAPATRTPPPAPAPSVAPAPPAAPSAAPAPPVVPPVAPAPPTSPDSPAAATPGAPGEAVPFVVENPYPPAPVVRGRLPPPRLYAIPAPRPKPPRRHGDQGAPFSLGIGASFVYRDDVGYRRLGAEGHQVEFDLFGSYDVLQVGHKAVIAAGLGYRFGSIGSDAELLVTSHAVSAELLARLKLDWFAPHLRAAAGVLSSRVQLEDPSAQLRLEDRETSGLGVFGAGLTLRTPSRLFETYSGHLASLSLGVLIEGGYVLAKAASFHPRPSGDGDVAQQAPALGSLAQSGGYLRLLGVLRF